MSLSGDWHLWRPHPKGLGKVSELPSPTSHWMWTRHQAPDAALFTQLHIFSSADVPSWSPPSFHSRLNTPSPWAGGCSEGSGGTVQGCSSASRVTLSISAAVIWSCLYSDISAAEGPALAPLICSALRIMAERGRVALCSKSNNGHSRTEPQSVPQWA